MGWNIAICPVLLLWLLRTEAGVVPVEDLTRLLHQYEDQFLGRKVGGLPSDEGDETEEGDNVGVVGHPVEIHGWDNLLQDDLKLGQVSAVSVSLDDDPVIFHRGTKVIWDGGSFDQNNQLVARDGPAIADDVIITLDMDKGKIKDKFGGGMFYMPHGLDVDHEGNIWVTDVGLHQVLKFSKGETKPSLVIGEKFVPGRDKKHFCKPTSTAVASNGLLFVADGYCNNRVAVFDSQGNHLQDLTGDWNVVHSVTLFEQEDVLCVADREGQKVECMGAGLKSPQLFGEKVTEIKNLGRVFAVASRGTALLTVNGRGSYFDPPVRGVTVDLASDNQVVDTWGDELINPHDIAISRAGDSVYVVEIGPNAVRKFEVVAPQPDIY